MAFQKKKKKTTDNNHSFTIKGKMNDSVCSIPSTAWWLFAPGFRPYTQRNNLATCERGFLSSSATASPSPTCLWLHPAPWLSVICPATSCRCNQGCLTLLLFGIDKFVTLRDGVFLDRSKSQPFLHDKKPWRRALSAARRRWVKQHIPCPFAV